MFLETKDRGSLEAAILEYERARAAWEAMSSRAAKVYRKDITFGSRPVEHGHWADRLPAIDKDLLAMKALLPTAVASAQTTQAAKAVSVAQTRVVRPNFKATHQAPATFRPGQVLPLSISIAESEDGGEKFALIMHYRHVNQAERWQEAAMIAHRGTTYEAEIDGVYTQSVYPLQYYFELRRGDEKASLYPGFNSELNNQPYFVIQAS